MRWLSAQLRDTVAVIGSGLGTLFRNLPQLLAVFLAGYCLRMGVIWLAGKAATFSTTLASLLLPGAPLVMIATLVVMLRIAARSLPGAREGEGMSASIRAVIVVVLPFLAIYASNGFLRQDMRRYIQDQTGVAWQRFTAGDFSAGLFDRVALPATWSFFFVVILALTLRKVIAWRELASKSLGWVVIATYLEALWMMSVGFVVTEKTGLAKNWLFSRAATEDFVAWWNNATGLYATIVVAPFKYLATLVSPFTALIVVPVAWLTIGATIYGSSLKAGDPIVDPQIVTKRIGHIPNPVRRTLGHVVEPAITPVRASAKALSKVAIAGIIPMILFCIIFVLAGWLRVGVRLAIHNLMGPMVEDLVFALEPFAALADSAVYFLVVICLVAAAVSRIISRQNEHTGAGPT